MVRPLAALVAGICRRKATSGPRGSNHAAVNASACCGPLAQVFAENRVEGPYPVGALTRPRSIRHVIISLRRRCC